MLPNTSDAYYICSLFKLNAFDLVDLNLCNRAQMCSEFKEWVASMLICNCHVNRIQIPVHFRV